MYAMSGFDPRILILLMKMIYVGKITRSPRSVGIFLYSLVSPESELALKYQNVGDLFSFGHPARLPFGNMADSVFYGIQSG